MAGLRRILEEDLKLDKFTLDSFKKMISQELDEVSCLGGIIYLIDVPQTMYFSCNYLCFLIGIEIF